MKKIKKKLVKHISSCTECHFFNDNGNRLMSIPEEFELKCDLMDKKLKNIKWTLKIANEVQTKTIKPFPKWCPLKTIKVSHKNC